MTSRDRHGLTLAELLILLIVFGVILALLVSWLLARREGTRRTLCEERQKRLADALLAYEARNGSFPGYVNQIAKRPDGSTLAGSWVVPVLPALERADLLADWKKGEPTAAHLSLVICPDRGGNSAPDGPPLSYVVNCGLPGDQDTPATGIFMNHNMEKPVYVTLKDVENGNGASHVLLMSENLQAGYWTDTAEADVGMVWFREPGECSRVNQCRDVGPRPQDIQYARPSSYHPGVVVVAYCDGRVTTLSDRVDYAVFQQLMAPNNQAAGLRGAVNEAKIVK